MEPGGHYDQPVFATVSGTQISGTLVLLIRRLHPYLAHLNNDTVADEKIRHGKWEHLVFRYHDGRQSIFLNGRLAVSSNNHSRLFSDRPLIIGAWNSRFFKGKLRDLRIYSAALNANDIKLLFEKTGLK